MFRMLVDVRRFSRDLIYGAQPLSHVLPSILQFLLERVLLVSYIEQRLISTPGEYDNVVGSWDTGGQVEKMRDAWRGYDCVVWLKHSGGVRREWVELVWCTNVFIDFLYDWPLVSVGVSDGRHWWLMRWMGKSHLFYTDHIMWSYPS